MRGFSTLFQAIGKTACGKELFFRRKLHGWSIRELRGGGEDAGSCGDEPLYKTTDEFSFPHNITPEVMRHIAAPEIEFSPDSLLPVWLNDANEVASHLAAGANPNFVPERILARDDFGVEWLLDHGANPNLSPSPWVNFSDPDSFDLIAPVRDLLEENNPRLIRRATLDDLFGGRMPYSQILQVLEHSADGKVYPSLFHPLVAALLTDNQSAFELLVSHGADVHAVSVFHRCIPPDWAFERLASLETDWQQPFGEFNHSSVFLWHLLPDSPVKSAGIELWEKYASPADRRHLEESRKTHEEKFPGPS